MNRAAFVEAADAFVGVVARVPPDAWDRAGALGEWTTRELVAHAMRAFLTLDEAIEAGGDTVTLERPASYFSAALADPAVHRSVAERGRAAGRDLPTPLAQVRAARDRAVSRLDATADDAVVTMRFGSMRLDDYLPTRVVELFVHTLDLTSALGLADPDAPLAREVAATTLAAVATARGAGTGLVRALAGRGPLPDDVNALR
jgi:uncharacterized protein (TIGR03083 family)